MPSRIAFPAFGAQTEGDIGEDGCRLFNGCFEVLCERRVLGRQSSRHQLQQQLEYASCQRAFHWMSRWSAFLIVHLCIDCDILGREILIFDPHGVPGLGVLLPQIPLSPLACVFILIFQSSFFDSHEANPIVQLANFSVQVYQQWDNLPHDFLQ